jgi:3-oxoacyl-[acyl-carrier-protein] synthase II
MTRLTDHKGRPRVVITGMGAITPCGKDLSTSWENLINGQSGIAAITQFDSSDYPTKFAGEASDFVLGDWLDKKEIRRNARFILLAIAAAEMAMEDANYKIDPAEAHRVGVVVGAGLGGLAFIENNTLVIEKRGPGKISPFFIPAVIANLAPGQISIRMGAKGPNWSPVSACASGAHAIGESTEMIRRGQCDAVLAGGAESVISPLGIGGFNAMRALSTRNDAPEKASRPWDKDRDGFVMGEGAGLILLESLEHALARGAKIQGELLGYGATADASHITAPDGEGASRCMTLAVEDSGLGVADIAYVNAHGTSTPVGDKQEVDAVKKVFGAQAQKLMMTSTKSMHGHLLGATGAVEAIISAKVIQTGIVPPTINLDNPSDGCDLDFVPHIARKQNVNAALTNSFGFGGTNASLVLAKYEE